MGLQDSFGALRSNGPLNTCKRLQIVFLLFLQAQVLQGQQNVTDSTDVAALIALLSSTTNHGGRMLSWTPGKDPCGAANCTAGTAEGPLQYPTAVPRFSDNASLSNSCQWEGISCTNWRVSGVRLGCAVNDNTCARLQGSLPAALGDLSELSVLDIQRNTLMGQLPDEMGKLTKLQIVRLGFNKLALLLPRAWSGMSSLRFLDLRSNALTGTLPLSWNGLTSLQALLLDHNALTGFIPSTWGSLEGLQVLSLGSTSLAGPIPQSWSNMTSLQVLDIGNACGICGNLPTFPQAPLGRPQVESTGSSLGWNCQRGQCGGGFPISIVAQAVICVSIVCGLILLCLLRRLVQHYYPNALLIYPVAPRMQRRSPAMAASQAAAREMEMARAAEEERRRAKAKPGSLVINPDGYTYSYAVKIEAVSEGSTSRHSRTGSQALDEAESGGRPETAGGSSDACALQRRGAAVVDAHDPGPACDAQGSSSQGPQANRGGPAGSHGERDVPIEGPVTYKGSSGRGVGGEHDRCIASQSSGATHGEASSSQGTTSSRTQQQTLQRPML